MRSMPHSMAAIADFGASLRGFSLAQPEPGMVAALYRELAAEGAPALSQGKGCAIACRSRRWPG
jgi:hypothetical protein